MCVGFWLSVFFIYEKVRDDLRMMMMSTGEWASLIILSSRHLAGILLHCHTQNEVQCKLVERYNCYHVLSIEDIMLSHFLARSSFFLNQFLMGNYFVLPFRKFAKFYIVYLYAYTYILYALRISYSINQIQLTIIFVHHWYLTNIVN